MDSLTILGASASPYNDLQIPAVMSSVYLITKGVAFGLWVLFMLAETFRLKVQAVRAALPAGSGEKPAFGDLFFRGWALFVSLAFLYQWAFLKLVSICDHVAMLVSNEDQWMTLIATLSQNGSVTIPFLNVTVPTLVGAIALTALQYVEEIFITIRFVVLALLYCIGPIAWAFGVSELGAGALRGWFKNTWQVSFWLVVFSVVKAAVIPLAIGAFSNGAAEGSVVAVIYAIVILAAIFMTPTLTAAVFSESNMGAVASAAMTIATYSTARAAAARGESLHAGIVGDGRLRSVAEAMRVYKDGGSGLSGAAAVLRGLTGYEGGPAAPASDAARTR